MGIPSLECEPRLFGNRLYKILGKILDRVRHSHTPLLRRMFELMVIPDTMDLIPSIGSQELNDLSG